MNFFKRIWQSFMRGPVWVILFGLVFFGIGAGLTYRQFMIRQDAFEVPGEVIRLNESCDDEGCTYSPVVRFTTQDGRQVTYNSTFSSSPPAYDIGEQVTMFYQPDDPQRATIKGEGGVFRFIFAGVGGVIIVVGLAFFASNIKNSYLEENIPH